MDSIISGTASVTSLTMSCARGPGSRRLPCDLQRSSPLCGGAAPLVSGGTGEFDDAVVVLDEDAGPCFGEEARRGRARHVDGGKRGAVQVGELAVIAGHVVGDADGVAEFVGRQVDSGSREVADEEPAVAERSGAVVPQVRAAGSDRDAAECGHVVEVGYAASSDVDAADRAVSDE